MSQTEKERIKDVLMKLSKMGRDDKFKEFRNIAKNDIHPPLEYLVQEAIGDDSKYTKQMGIISRSYRGTGGFGKADFDIHLPINTPEGTINFTETSLPFVQLSVKTKKKGSYQDSLVATDKLSPLKLKQELLDKFQKCAKDFNEQYTDPKVTVLDLQMNQPLTVIIEPKGKGQVFCHLIPVIFADTLDGINLIKERIKNDPNCKWPKNPEFRDKLSDQILLMPRGDGQNWLISMMLAHKSMVHSLDDDGRTCCMDLYRSLKTLNKRYWSAGSDQETFKICANSLQNAFFTVLSRHSDADSWSHDKMTDRFKGVVSDMRIKLARGELKEYFQPGSSFNPLSVYKQGSFLIPKLGTIVRKIEGTLKDPLKILEEIAKSDD